MSIKQNGYAIRLRVNGKEAILGDNIVGEPFVPFRTKRFAGRIHSLIVSDWRRGYYGYLLPYTSARTGFSAHNNSQTRRAVLQFRASPVGVVEVVPNYVEVSA